MELKEASVSLKVPLPVLKRMVTEGLISSPLDGMSIHTVSVLGHLLGKKWFAGVVMKGIKSRRERVAVALFPDYDKIDRYILNTYLNEPEGKQVSIYMLRYQLNKSFSADIKDERIRRLRQVAYDIRRDRTRMKLGKSNITYADLLGIGTGRKEMNEKGL